MTNHYVICGGANGFGSVIAQNLAATGCLVSLLDIDPVAGEQLAMTSESITFFPTDITDEEWVDDVFQRTVQTNGEFRIIINLVGSSCLEQIGEMEIKEFDRVFELNAKTATILCNSAVRYYRTLNSLPSGERGIIVNVSSNIFRKHQLQDSLYSGSKASMITMSAVWAEEVIDDKIRIFIALHGEIIQPLFRHLNDSHQKLIYGDHIDIKSYAQELITLIENAKYESETIVDLEQRIRNKKTLYSGELNVKMTSSMIQELLDKADIGVKELAAYLEVTEKDVLRWIETGDVPAELAKELRGLLDKVYNSLRLEETFNTDQNLRLWTNFVNEAGQTAVDCYIPSEIGARRALSTLLEAGLVLDEKPPTTASDPIATLISTYFEIQFLLLKWTTLKTQYLDASEDEVLAKCIAGLKNEISKFSVILTNKITEDVVFDETKYKDFDKNTKKEVLSYINTISVIMNARGLAHYANLYQLLQCTKNSLLNDITKMEQPPSILTNLTYAENEILKRLESLEDKINELTNCNVNKK